MTVTASLQWVCVLGFGWLMAFAGRDALVGDDYNGPIYHILNRFHYRLINGAAWGLFGFPLVASVMGFFVLMRARWTRWALTGLAVASLAWSGYVFRDNLVAWACLAAYIAVAAGILWLPGVSRWYAWSAPKPGVPIDADGRPQELTADGRPLHRWPR